MANVRGPGNSPGDWFASLPPVSKAFAIGCVGTTAAWQLGLVHHTTLMLYWPLVLKLQIWRLFSNFFLLGRFSMHFVFQIIWILTYGVQLENTTFQFNTADYVYMLLFGMAASTVLGLVVPFLFSAFQGTSLVFMLCYVWSRSFPSNSVSIWGLFTVQAFYVPWCFLAITVMLGENWKPDLVGIVCGHLYFFLKVLHPMAGGRSYLDTPQWLKVLVWRAGIGRVPVQEINPHNPAQPTFRAFRGQGRRLAD